MNWKHLYSTAAWGKLRAGQLLRQPLCEFCLPNHISPATVVDHIIPHKGDPVLFFSSDNLQSLCKQCHDSAKQSAEKRGVAAVGCDEDGTPLDPTHHWRGGEG